MNLYKLTYTQESEAYVSAESEDEAREYITELTDNGGKNMHQVRLVECGWSVEQEYENLESLDDDIQYKSEDWTDYTHETENGSGWYHDFGRLFWDQGE